MNSAQEVIQALKATKKPIICMDSRVDFDSLCSAVIVHDYLSRLGVETRVTLDGTLLTATKEIASDYANLDFIEENVCPSTKIKFDDYDLQIYLDSGGIDHICKDALDIPNKNITKLDIDHHEGNVSYGDLNYVKPRASTATVLFELFNEANIPINTNLANLYYLAVLLDSGFFKYDTVTAEDFYMAAELLRMGASAYEINWKLTFNERLDDMKMRGLIYSNMVVVEEKKVAYSTITLEEVEKLGIDMNNCTQPPSDMIKLLKGIDFAFVVKELESGEYNISLRSHEKGFSVLEIAKKLGGSGHFMAAGANIAADSLADAVNKVLKTAKTF